MHLFSFFFKLTFFLCPPCLHSQLFVCSRMHPYLFPLVFPSMSPQMSPPGYLVPNSYYSQWNMSEQRHHVILRQVKVLILLSIETSGSSCGWHQYHPCYLPKLCQSCQIQISIFLLTKMTVSPVNFGGCISALLTPLWSRQACQPILLHPQHWTIIWFQCWPIWRSDHAKLNLLQILKWILNISSFLLR